MRSQWYCALNENCHFANTTTVENKHCTHHLKQSGTKCKKIYLIYGMCLLFVIFRCPYTLSAAEQRVCFERRSTSKGKYQFFFIVLVKIFSADTFSRTVCSIYSFINSLDVLLLGVVKLASRKNWKDYGVLRTCIRELKFKR